ncbi:hypothetical protein U1Q18_031535 [Sarracenia purpurea var. burkii]
MGSPNQFRVLEAIDSDEDLDLANGNRTRMLKPQRELTVENPGECRRSYPGFDQVVESKEDKKSVNEGDSGWNGMNKQRALFKENTNGGAKVSNDNPRCDFVSDKYLVRVETPAVKFPGVNMVKTKVENKINSLENTNGGTKVSNDNPRCDFVSDKYLVRVETPAVKFPGVNMVKTKVENKINSLEVEAKDDSLINMEIGVKDAGVDCSWSVRKVTFPKGQQRGEECGKEVASRGRGVLVNKAVASRV